MLVLTDQQRRAIAELCRRYGIRRLEIFGSAATERFDEMRSDVDILVDLGPASSSALADAWFALEDQLPLILGRPIDLVSDAAIRNPYFRASLEHSRHTVYAA